jgi:hypothetical protein
MNDMRTGRILIRRIAAGLMAGSALVWSLHAFAGAGEAVPYPSEYRKWAHVKSTLIGPQHASFASNGGIHHYYANEKAMEGYRTGKFPDGSVLIDDLLEMKENAGVTSEGTRRRVAVMAKDSQRYRETGGWGFEIFRGDNQDATLTAQAKAACFACHGKKEDHDYVFSEFRK